MKPTSEWYAFVKEDGTSAVGAERITVFRFSGADDDSTTYAFLSRNGRAQPWSDEKDLIEYIPPDAFVERGDELFWRQFINGRVTFTKVASKFVEGKS